VVNKYNLNKKTMGEIENKQREEIFSKSVRAGKRTYFFDVKATKSGEQYITITESKKKFNQEDGKFFYEKHKLFLYKEDFDKFAAGLLMATKFVETGEIPAEEEIEEEYHSSETITESNTFSDVTFEDLDSHDTHK